MKLTLQKGQQLYFTSDTHFSHSNICSATTKWQDAGDTVRQFSSLDEMNRTIVNNINAVVGENDILFHLGDWSFGGFEQIQKFRSQLICKNIHIVLGNHDHHIEKDKDGVQSLFSSVHSFIPKLEVKREVGGGDGMMQRFNFCVFHYPIASWIDMNQGVIHLHGHVHLPKNLKLGKGRSLDVGMDGNDMKPYSLDEVMRLVKNQPIRKLELPKDHHEKRLADDK
jgi:calcineurin-like phosphoesterase family protein